MFDIYCLMVHGHGLTDDVRNCLFDAAQEMLKKRKERRKIQKEFAEGLVTTKFKHVCFGAIAGIAFQAEIETDAYKTKVRFVVRPGDIPLEDRTWCDGVPYEPSMN